MAGICVLTITFSILGFRYQYSDFEHAKDTIVGRIKENVNHTLGEYFGQVRWPGIMD